MRGVNVVLMTFVGLLVLVGCGSGGGEQFSVGSGNSQTPAKESKLPTPMAKLPRHTIAEVTAGLVPIGTDIRISGVYLGYGTRQALGPQPLTRSDWQLVDDGRAIWVTGRFPEGSHPLQGGDDPITITARVDCDKVTGMKEGSAKDRWYLVLLGW